MTEHRNKYLQNPRTQPILPRFPGYENWMGVLRFVKQQQNVFVIYSVLLPSLIHVPFLQLPPVQNLSKIAAHLILCWSTLAAWGQQDTVQWFMRARMSPTNSLTRKVATNWTPVFYPVLLLSLTHVPFLQLPHAPNPWVDKTAHLILCRTTLAAQPTGHSRAICASRWGGGGVE